MRRIYEPRDLIEAQMLIDMLDSEGIRAHLLGGHLLGALGDLPCGGVLALAVEDDCAAQASRLIADYSGAAPLPGEMPEDYSGDLLC